MLNVLNAPTVVTRPTTVSSARHDVDTSAGWSLAAIIEIVFRRIKLIVLVAAVIVLLALIYV